MLERARVAQNLVADLEVNLPGVAVQKIGELTVSLDWLKKKSKQLGL